MDHDQNHRKCPDCGEDFTGESHTGCPAAGKPPSEPPPSASSAPVDPDVTLRKCNDCGETFTGTTHVNCPATLKTPSSKSASTSASSSSSLDEIPEEAQKFSGDPSRRIGQYVLVKQIGKGGMGAVWKAWDLKLTRWVAIKFLLTAEEANIQRFYREAKLAARLRHPNIAPIYEVGEAPPSQAGGPPQPFLAMEFIDGKSMANVKLEIREAVDIFVRVAEGVETAHQEGVVHRDLKPQNIMLTKKMWPYVMDFGLAKALAGDSSLSVSGAVMGTPAYMPPEQAMGKLKEIDGRTDVYSLGATMYAVFTGKQPFRGESAMAIIMKVCNEEVEPLRTHVPDFPEALETIVLKAMAKSQEDRYATAGELAEDLKRYLDDQEIVGKAPPVRKKKSNRLPLIATLLVLLAAGGIGIFLATRPEEKPPDPVKPVSSGPVTPPLPVGPTEAEIKAQKADAWLGEWRALRPKIGYQRWVPGEPDLSARAHAILLRMKDEADTSDFFNEGEWLEQQATEATDAARSLGRDRQKAEGLIHWCDMFLAALQGVENLKGTAGRVSEARDAARKVADFKGTFTLRVAVGPFARITRLLKNGKEVPVGIADTPLVLSELEIGNYEMTLTHPTLGEKKISLEEKKLSDGKTYMISGLMHEALKFSELP